MSTPPVILSIAGFDPSSGAGVTADIKTAAAHGCYGVTCITSLTVQSTKGVRDVQPVASRLVKETLAELLSDLQIAAVHVGMLGAADVADTVAEFLEESGLKNVVLDPIVRSSSGADLLGPGGLELVRDRLLPLSTVATPNIDEASALVGMSVTSVREMREAASRLRQLGLANVVITGGHLDPAVDLLSTPDGEEEFLGPHLDSRSTHGTGCAFSTALACQLARGASIRQAVIEAKDYVREAIENAYVLGQGTGPVNHLYRFRAD